MGVGDSLCKVMGVVIGNDQVWGNDKDQDQEEQTGQTERKYPV